MRTRGDRFARCRYCGRFAEKGLVVRFYLLYVIPLVSTTIHFCETHEQDVHTVVGQAVRWLSNALWGIRFSFVMGGPDMAPHPSRRS
jgi:hypothetical protein